jgi:hypothetical protein
LNIHAAPDRALSCERERSATRTLTKGGSAYCRCRIYPTPGHHVSTEHTRERSLRPAGAPARAPTGLSSPARGDTSLCRQRSPRPVGSLRHFAGPTAEFPHRDSALGMFGPHGPPGDRRCPLPIASPPWARARLAALTAAARTRRRATLTAFRASASNVASRTALAATRAEARRCAPTSEFVANSLATFESPEAPGPHGVCTTARQRSKTRRE